MDDQGQIADSDAQPESAPAVESAAEPAQTPAWANLADLIAWQASEQGDAVALVIAGTERREWTWAALERRIAAVAAGLTASGAVGGQRIVLHARNSDHWIVLYFAALRAGLVVVPISPDADDAELAAMIATTGARLLATETADPAVESALVTVRLDQAGLDTVAEAGRTVEPVSSPVDPETLAALLSTAGTSGDSKLVMLSHRALLANCEHQEAAEVSGRETIVLGLVPLFHVFGLNAVVGAWARSGSRLVLVNNGLDRVGEVLVSESITNLPAAPAVLYRLLHAATLPASSTLKVVVSGAAPLPVALAAAFTELTGVRVDQGYGLTEAAPGVTTTFGGDLDGPGHVGRPLPGVEVRIGDGTTYSDGVLDRSGETEPGEIFIRGDNLFSGYWPEGQGGPDPDGWFPTGDIGYLSHSELHLVDRAGELVSVRGFPVYPAEVEQVIRDIDGITGVAVIGQATDAGEQIVAFVSGSLTEAEVSQALESRLARFKRPAVIRRVERLPRGVTGKIMKGALRRMLAEPDSAGSSFGGPDA